MVNDKTLAWPSGFNDTLDCAKLFANIKSFKVTLVITAITSLININMKSKIDQTIPSFRGLMPESDGIAR